jgi:3-oxoacyl-[acyl-carrier protein] reductase
MSSVVSRARVALVTGAASGLAQGIACDLARAGYRIAFTFRPSGTSPDATLALVRPFDPDALGYPADVADPHAAQPLVDSIVERCGSVDVLVHAVGPIVVRPFAESSYDDYRAMADGNLGSAVALAHAVLPAMRERRFGRIVMFGMNGSSVTQPASTMSLYAAAKAGVVTFARTLAIEEAPNGISVNVIEPGDIRDKSADRAHAATIASTNPTGHAGSWEDIAAAVRFAVADDNGFCNGMVLSVNGGRTEPFE